ncbi:MAG TPA: rhodanese-like domain-containing protein [Chloroflexi bacterium]|nr:rhodanese-like domain-containing protein [Chloroflexota bacterium]
MRKRAQQIQLFGLALILLVLTGCGAASIAAPAAEAIIIEPTLPRNLSVAEVHALYTDPDVTVIDVREAWEYAEGHIPGALLLPLDQLPARLNEIPTDQMVIFVCRSDNRSGQATNYARQRGFTNVHNMLGGMIAWQAAGYDIDN